MDGGTENDVKVKKIDVSSALPVKPVAVPGPGRTSVFSCSPLRLSTSTCVVTSLRYEANSLPPAVVAVSSGCARSGTTTFHALVAGAAGSNSITRPFGAP